MMLSQTRVLSRQTRLFSKALSSCFGKITCPVTTEVVQYHSDSGQGGTMPSKSESKTPTHTKYHIPYPTPAVKPAVSMTDQVLNFDDHMLKVMWGDGSSTWYPFIYLRDNCQCTSCFHPSSQQRLVLTMTLDMDIQPADSQLSTDGQEVSITWPDGHVSAFTSDWLNERRFPQKEDKIDLDKKNVAGENTILWDGSLNGQIPEIDFEKVLEDDLTLFHWMDILSKLGLVLLVNTPTESGQMRRLADRVGHLKPTNYGDLFEVISKRDASNLAYTPKYLQLHIDLPFYHYQPGVQLLHCIEQFTGEGGVNHLVDGFNIAQQLRDIDLEGYKFMCTTPLTFNDVGTDHFGDYNMRFTRPPIGVDSKGNIVSVNINNHVRDSLLKFPVEKVIPMYKYYYKMIQLMYDPKNLVERKLNPGDILCMNNVRVMHGRTAYDPDQGGTRWLQGMYFDWDMIHSTMRVIAKKHQLETHIWS